MRRRKEDGQVLPLMALCLVVLMGFAGMAVDIGYWDYQQRQQQSATDAAALGGARQLLVSGCGAAAAATTAADADAANNGYANGGNVVITVQNPPPNAGPYGGNDCAVEVQIQKANVATFFTKLFGYENGMPETTQATAQATQNGGACIYLLSTSTRSIFNGDTVQAPSCSILINDTATFNGDPTFGSPYIGYAGAAPIENGTTFTQATPAPMLLTADPCPEISGCNYLTQNPPTTSGCTSAIFNGLATANIAPGCYNSLIVNGCTNVTFTPGTYVFNGTTIINGEQSVSGSGVTLYVTASGTPPTFNGIPNISLSPPTSGNNVGVLYYEAAANAQNPIFNGVSDNLSGLIYAPGANGAIFNGTKGGYVVIVVGAATFNGSGAYDFASPPPNGSLIGQGVLGQ